MTTDANPAPIALYLQNQGDPPSNAELRHPAKKPPSVLERWLTLRLTTHGTSFTKSEACPLPDRPSRPPTLEKHSLSSEAGRLQYSLGATFTTMPRVMSSVFCGSYRNRYGLTFQLEALVPPLSAGRGHGG